MKIIRMIVVAAVLAGVVLTAAGPATITGLLPYFTIQSNIGYGIFAAWAAFRGRDTPPALKGAVTLYVVITGLVYHLVLTNPASGFAIGPVERTLPETIGNQLLHTVVPLLAVLDWLLFDQRGRFRWRYALYWLAFPARLPGLRADPGARRGQVPVPVHQRGRTGLRRCLGQRAGFRGRVLGPGAAVRGHRPVRWPAVAQRRGAGYFAVISNSALSEAVASPPTHTSNVDGSVTQSRTVAFQ